MVKLFSAEHTFNHPFERVTSAFWRKCQHTHTERQAEPTRAGGGGTTCWSSLVSSLVLLRVDPNEAAQHVKAIDITDRRIDSQGRLITNRIMSCESALPSWLRAAGLPQACFVAESSVVDPRSRTMVVKSSNLSGASLMVVEETCTYQQSAASPAATHYKQEARITAFLPFLAGKFESYSVANLQSKSREGMAVVEKLCQKIKANGVLSLLHFDSEATSATTTTSAQ